MAMQLVGHGRYELTIRQENEKVRSDYDLLGFPMFHIQGRNFISLNLQNEYGETFRLAGELIPTNDTEIVKGNTVDTHELLNTEKQLREQILERDALILEQAEELSRWRKYPTPGSSTSSMTLLDWLFYLRNEQIDEHTISALMDWLEEKGETVRLEMVRHYLTCREEHLPHVLRYDLIFALLKV